MANGDKRSVAFILLGAACGAALATYSLGLRGENVPPDHPQARQASFSRINPFVEPSLVEPEAPPVEPRAPVSELGRVRAAGVMINSPASFEENGMESLAFYGTFARTRIALELSHPEGGLIDFDRDASTLLVFGDDRGSNLIAPGSFGSSYEMMPRVSADGRFLICHLQSERQPQAGATELRVKGELTVRLATEKVQYTSPRLPLRAGTTFATGPFPFEFEGMGPSEWSDGWSVSLTTMTDPAPITRWALIAEDGSKIEMTRAMELSGGESWSLTLSIPVEIAGEAALFVEAWKEPREVRVPYELTTPLGLR